MPSSSPAKEAQRRYLDCFTEEEQTRGFRKPWSDPGCGGYLADVGSIIDLLPPPPGRLLDLGCGMGWTSCLFARRGYDVVGLDLAENMIAMAERRKLEERLTNVRFVARDFEERPEQLGEFDCAVFYDSLHHSDDERRALDAVYRVLKPGGACVTCEPGVGHARHPESVEAVRRTGVNERDMEPARIIAAARAAGFTRWRVYPTARSIFSHVYAGTYAEAVNAPMLRRLAGLARAVLWPAYSALRGHMDSGVVVLTK